MAIKIDFVDFWKGFDKKNNLFWSVLSENFDVEISEDPDLIIYSVYSLDHYKYKCHKLFYTAENVRPDFSKCDFAISFDHLKDARHYRLPLYVLYYYWNMENPYCLHPKREKEKFCNFIYSNPNCKVRNEFFKLLSEYKKVDSGGRHLNNLGYTVKDKLEFINDYKFTIAFENASYSGYTTEKIIEPLLVKSIPIYWGSPVAKNEFNPSAFINVHDYASLKEVVEKIIEVDSDNSLYLDYFKSGMFIDNEHPEYFKKENLKCFFEKVLGGLTNTRPVSQSNGYYFNYLKDRFDKTMFLMNNQLSYYRKRILKGISING